MKKLIPMLALTAVLTASASNLNTPLDLTCDIYGISPSEIQNPKAVDWWATGSKMDGVELYINKHGIQIIGAMIDRQWESYSGDITDWRIKIKFEQRGTKYNLINLSTLTGSGFFYIAYDTENADNDPDYKVSCEEVSLL